MLVSYRGYPVNSHQRRILKRMLKRHGLSAVPIQQPDIPQKTPENSIAAQTKRLLTRGVSKIVGLILAAATLVGYVVLVPRVDVDPYASLNPNNPFAQQFVVQNNSVYSLRDVFSGCSMNSVLTDQNSGLSGLTMFPSRTLSKKTGEQMDVLEPNAKMTVGCNPHSVFLGRFTDLHVTILVMYRLPLGIHRCKGVRFLGKSTSNSTFIWTYQGTDACDWYERPQT